FTVTVVLAGTGNNALSNTASLTITVGGATQSAGGSVTYQAGWNLTGVPSGTILALAASPLYTFQAGDTEYENVPTSSTLIGGRGYWAYFTVATTINLPGGSTTPLSITLPAGQYVMVGNPSANLSMTVSGADVVYTFSNAANDYAPAATTATLPPGQGAWV